MQIFKVHFFSFLSFLSPSSAPCKEESISSQAWTPATSKHCSGARRHWFQLALLSVSNISTVYLLHYHVSTMYLPCIYCQGPLTTPAIIHDTQSAARLRKCGVARGYAADQGVLSADRAGEKWRWSRYRPFWYQSTFVLSPLSNISI